MSRDKGKLREASLTAGKSDMQLKALPGIALPPARDVRPDRDYAPSGISGSTRNASRVNDSCQPA